MHQTPQLINNWERMGAFPVAVDALVPKHQGISIHSTDQVNIIWNPLHKKILQLLQTTLKQLSHILLKKEPFVKDYSLHGHCLIRNMLCS